MMNDPDMNTPPLQPPTPAYNGTWTLRAASGTDDMILHDIRSFEYVDGHWFVSAEGTVTAVCIANWDHVTLTCDE